MAAAPFPPLYQIRAPPDRHATSFECFFFFFPLTLHLIVPPCTMKNRRCLLEDRRQSSRLS